MITYGLGGKVASSNLAIPTNRKPRHLPGSFLYSMHFPISCFVYILYSRKGLKYYAGITNDLSDRLNRHNKGESLSTKYGLPWELVYSEECANKSVAMALEIKIKKQGIRRYLEDHNLKPE